MWKYRKRKKSKFLIILFAFVVSISLGYAYLERNLNINGSSYLAGNTWKINFENFVVTEGSVEPTSPVSFDDKKATIDFGVDLNLPGEFFEFTVDIVNKGTIGASLDAFIKTTLTAEQKKYLKFTVTYVDGSPINVADFLEKDKSLSIIVRIEYIRYSDENEVVPATDQYIDLNLSFKFVQDDGLTKDFMKRIKLNAKVDDFVNFGNAPSSTNGQGVMIKADTKNDENPIYYYRGNVDNNNVRWADKCWKIIRTTDTGGVKMIYNGLPDENGFCNNSGAASALSSKSVFNSISRSPASIGYMYGTVPTISSRSFYDYPLSFNAAFYNSSYGPIYNGSSNSTSYGYSKASISYSTSVSWDEETKKYTLISPSTIAGYYPNHAYTCGDSNTSCSSVRYVYGNSSRSYTSGNTTYYESYYTYLNFNNGEIRNSDNETIGLCSDYRTSSYKDGDTWIYNYYPTYCRTYSYIDFVSSGLSSYYYACDDMLSFSCNVSNIDSLKVNISTQSYNGLFANVKISRLSNKNMKFSHSVIYENGYYKLNNPVSRVWHRDDNYTKIASLYPYSCFSDSDTCTSVNYIFDDVNKSGSSSYITFTDGNVMTNDYLNSMFTNENTSVIKDIIETWYSSELVDYSEYIEDTIYCNDRSHSGLDANNVFKFNTQFKYSNSYSLDCLNSSDSFTLSNQNGNGLLNYPIGLITADEAFIVGAYKSDTYLGSNVDYWTMTPSNSAKGLFYLNSRLSAGLSPNSSSYVRPVISIKGDFTIKGGNGSSNSPFYIK